MVSTDHTVVSGSYCASQFITVEEDTTYKVGIDWSNYHSIAVCCFDANGNLIEYQANVIKGPQHNDSRVALQHEIVLPENTVSFRLRLYVAINATNSMDAVLGRIGYWLTKTYTKS